MKYRMCIYSLNITSIWWERMPISLSDFSSTSILMYAISKGSGETARNAQARLSLHCLLMQQLHISHALFMSF